MSTQPQCKTYCATVGNASEAVTFSIGLAALTAYTIEIVEQNGDVHNVDITTDIDGQFSINFGEIEGLYASRLSLRIKDNCGYNKFPIIKNYKNIRLDFKRGHKNTIGCNTDAATPPILPQ